MEVITQEIRTSLITIDDLIVNNLNVSHIHGAYDLNDIIFNSVSALQNIDFSTKIFTGQVLVKNISALNIKGTNIKGKSICMHMCARCTYKLDIFSLYIYYCVCNVFFYVDLANQMNKWIDVNRFKGPINISKLVVSALEVPVWCNFPLPTKVKNIIIKTDSNIKKINDLNMLSFMESILKVHDPISLQHVKFSKFLV